MASGTNSFNAVKVFSTTLARDREQMGETITRWIKDNPGIEIVDRTVTQSSDKEFHCLSITIFYKSK
jgi:folate-dependent tRNA-U54 methylase TrmFO/GidA